MLMMYASRITIDYSPQKIRTFRQVELPDGLLTLMDLAVLLGPNEKFGFQEKEDAPYGTTVYMNIHGEREETPEEMTIRITKAESYNAKYEEFHARHKK